MYCLREDLAPRLIRAGVSYLRKALSDIEQQSFHCAPILPIRALSAGCVNQLCSLSRCCIMYGLFQSFNTHKHTPCKRHNHYDQGPQPTGCNWLQFASPLVQHQCGQCFVPTTEVLNDIPVQQHLWYAQKTRRKLQSETCRASLQQASQLCLLDIPTPFPHLLFLHVSCLISTFPLHCLF